MPLPLIPIAVNAGVALGGYAVENAPKIKDSLMKYLKTASKNKIKSLPQIVAQAASGNVSSVALLGRGLAQSGMDVDKVLSYDMIKDLQRAAGAKLVDDMRSDFNAVYGAVDRTSMIHSPGDTAHEMILKNTFLWAQRQFGNNPRTLKEAHVQLKSFLAMDEAAVDHCIALYQR